MNEKQGMRTGEKCVNSSATHEMTNTKGLKPSICAQEYIYIQPDFYCYFRKKKHQNIFGFGAFVFGTNHSWSTSIMLDQNTINNIYNNLVFPNFISSEDAFCFLLSRRALFQRSIPLFLFPMTAHSKFSLSTR